MQLTYYDMSKDCTKIRDVTMMQKLARGIKHDDFIDQYGEESIEHYGVLGMKWGIHKDPQRAYERANQKLSKLDKKVVRADQKVAKAQMRSVSKQARANSALLFKKSKSRSAAKAIRKANQAHLKVQKKAAKAERWYKAMENVFRNVDVSALKTNSNYTELGKKYANATIDAMMANTTTGASMVQLIDYYEKGRRS